MSIEAELRDRLTGDATVGGLVGSRVFYGRLAQNAAMPAVTFIRITTGRESAMGVDGLASPSFQVDCWADDMDGVQALRDAVRARLQRWRDAASDPVVQDCFIEDEADMGLDPDIFKERARIDIRVHVLED